MMLSVGGVSFANSSKASLALKESIVLAKHKELYGHKLYKTLSEKLISNSDTLDVVVSFKEISSKASGFKHTLSAYIDETGKASVTINGVKASASDIEIDFENQLNRVDLERKKRNIAMKKKIDVFAKRNNLENNPSIIKAKKHISSSFSLNLSKNKIISFVESNKDLILSVELDDSNAKDDGLTSAMAYTKISTDALPFTTRRGNGIGVYMSETTCPNSASLTNYHIIQGSVLKNAHSENVGAIIRAVSPDSFIYCMGDATNPSVTPVNGLSGYGGNPRIYIESHSWSDGNLNSAVYRSVDRDFDNQVYNNKIVVFKSAGNNGDISHIVTSPGKGFNVITVGNYDDSTGNIFHQSSFTNSVLQNNKPEIVAPGVNILAGGYNYTGTSQATPHAAGFAADLMSEYSWMRLHPAFFKAIMLSSSTDVINDLDGTTVNNDKTGVGGINFNRAVYNSLNWDLNLDSNGGFNMYDNGDISAGNGFIDLQKSLSAGQNARVAISWLLRGDYTLARQQDAFPLGMDYDLRILDPSGIVIAESNSRFNPYEVVDFPVNTTGLYTIQISEFANRDSLNRFEMGVSIHW